jgi:hypothetical protein
MRKTLTQRVAETQMKRLRAETPGPPWVPEEAEVTPGLRPGDLLALHFSHDGEEFVAEVGQALGHGFSDYPVLAIFRGDPHHVWTADRNPVIGGEILVDEVIAEISFRSEAPIGGDR